MDPRKSIFDAIRAARAKGFTADEVSRIDALLDSLAVARDVPTAVTTPLPGEPKWTSALRTKLGQREIPGPKHNSWISKGWALLGAAWFTDDETPWCGFAQAWAMQQAGIAYPPKGQFARALAWADWGVPVPPTSIPVGAIGVKTRNGGGHVFQIVGITQDGLFYKALGGNQNNMVSITDIRVADVVAVRWPVGVPMPRGNLPIMPRGTTGGSES